MGGETYHGRGVFYPDSLNKVGTIHQAATKGHTKAMGLLLRQGANIEAANEEGMTPLLVAASQGRVIRC